MSGAQLQRVRVAARLSQAEVAREAGQHQTWVSRLERRPEVHASVANVYLAGIEAALQHREERNARPGPRLAAAGAR